MIKLNKEVDYAIQFLLHLSNQNQDSPLSLRKFSKNSNISFLFLQKIACKLREAKVVESVKGPNGGYVLKTTLDKLSLADISNIVVGEVNVVECIKYNKKCALAQECGAKGVFQKINNDLLNYLSSITIDKYVN